ncbi:MAG: tripartite tricarboxylate transporter substrate binding protein [Pseudomonadota bacterium]
MIIRRAICTSLLALFSIGAQAQSASDVASYPTRPIRMVLPLSPGTTTDLVARMFADRLAQHLGQPVTVDNRPGAGGVIATQTVAKSPADGYTILLVNSQHAINPAVYPTLPYDTLRDFTGIAMVGEAPSVITVPRELGVKNIGEFVAMAKRQPLLINYASSGIGSQTHLSGAYFAAKAGISITHVPYKSAPEVINDLVTNRVQATFVPAAFVLGQIQAGKLLALAVTGRERLGLLGDVPTVGETVIPGFEFSTWFGFVAPAKTPPQIVNRLARAMQSIAEESATQQKFTEQGITPRVLLAQKFDAYVKSEIGRLGPIALASGMREK